MARIVENPKGFKVIELSRLEIVHNIWGAMGICDCCNETAPTGYYIAVLNQWFCPKCYAEWLEYAEHYPDDEPYETHNFNNYKAIFGLD